MLDEFSAVEIATGANPTFTVIWLHGLGADGNDFVPVVPELGLSHGEGVRFIFPHAPRRPVTCNNGFVMRAWYDIIALDGRTRQIDEAGIRASRDLVRQLIRRENQRGIPTHRIALAGFSQGGAMAYIAGLTHPEPLAGVVALSCYVPSQQLLTDEFNPAQRATPIFAAHGTHDAVVQLSWGIQGRDTVLQLGCMLDWHEYPMAHSVCIEEIEEIGQWLTARLQVQLNV